VAVSWAPTADVSAPSWADGDGRAALGSKQLQPDVRQSFLTLSPAVGEPRPGATSGRSASRRR
jgi:hypothetical protein